MLRRRHTGLNRRPVVADIFSKMSTANHTAIDDVENTDRFAHELSNLLDGSMRNVALVRSLMHANDGDEVHDAGAAAEDDVLKRLQTAEQGMRQMAGLIKDWMSQRHIGEGLIGATTPPDGETLGDAINHARELHHPAAAALGIEITVHVSADAARLPAGAVFPVLANGLRNSIEAISADPRRGGRAGVVEVRAQLQTGQVRLSISDNGPGLSRQVFDTGGIFRFGKTTKPGGHGIGLTLCRDIAANLGGALRLTNRDDGGALLTLTYPVGSQSAVGSQQ